MTKRIACLVGPEYEDLEVWYPKLRLEEAGFEVPLVGMGDTSYAGKHGYPAIVDVQIGELDVAGLDGIIAPGGWAPDKLRRIPAVLDAVRAVHAAGKMVATVCHGPWILISAGIVRGRMMTGSLGVRDDVINAGGLWYDAPTVTDGNIVSARVPKDLPAFGVAMIEALATQSRR